MIYKDKDGEKGKRFLFSESRRMMRADSVLLRISHPGVVPLNRH
jgi:hypothetical protein